MNAVGRFLRNYRQAFSIERFNIWLTFFILATVQGMVVALTLKHDGATQASIDGLLGAYDFLLGMLAFMAVGRPALKALFAEVGRQWGDQIRRALGLEVEA